MSENRSNFVLNLSVLFRNTQKFFDRALAQYDIGSGQLMFLLFINENEGSTMQDVTKIGEVDKGTTTKSIQRLIEQGYVEAVTDEKDRRVKRLYTTEKAAGIMNAIYECRNQCRTMLAKDMDFETFEKMLSKASDNSRGDMEVDLDLANMHLGGLIKTSLKDYPDKMACTILVAGCNYKCPYCKNKDIVFIPENFEYIDVNEVLEYLEKRKGLLDAVSISGGEPLMQEALLPFFRKIKKMGYLIKLDTNGYSPEQLRKVLRSGIVDLVSMDIKNCKEKYAVTCGMNEEAFNIDAIEESIGLLIRSHTNYEFCTTVVKEYHTQEDLEKIATWIQGAKKYVIQNFEPLDSVIQPGLTPFKDEELEAFAKALEGKVKQIEIRGFNHV